MNDRDVAGQQVRELGQKQRRPQIAHQPFVEEAGRLIALGGGLHDRGVDREIPLAAAGGDDHVGPRQDFLVALDAGGIQRQPRRIGADALPGFHLALIALLGNLGVEIDRRPGVHDVGREILLVDIDAARVERVPVRVQPFAERGGKADAGDPDFGRRFGRFGFAHGVAACSGKPMRRAIASMCPRNSGFGNGITPNEIVALLRNSPFTRILASVTA